MFTLRFLRSLDKQVVVTQTLFPVTRKDSVRFPTGMMLPRRLMLARTTNCCWSGLPNTAEQRATNEAKVIAFVGPVLCSSSTCRWYSWSPGLIEALTRWAFALKKATIFSEIRRLQ